jgi:hypothetical protein
MPPAPVGSLRVGESDLRIGEDEEETVVETGAVHRALD